MYICSRGTGSSHPLTNWLSKLTFPKHYLRVPEEKVQVQVQALFCLSFGVLLPGACRKIVLHEIGTA